MNKTKVVIEVEGGVVQEIYSSDPNVEVVLVDWDTEGSDDDRLIEVKDSDGRECWAWASKFPAVSLDDLPQTTRLAVEQAE